MLLVELRLRDELVLLGELMLLGELVLLAELVVVGELVLLGERVVSLVRWCSWSPTRARTRPVSAPFREYPWFGADEVAHAGEGKDAHAGAG